MAPPKKSELDSRVAHALAVKDEMRGLQPRHVELCSCPIMSKLAMASILRMQFGEHVFLLCCRTILLCKKLAQSSTKSFGYFSDTESKLLSVMIIDHCIYYGFSPACSHSQKGPLEQ